MRGMVEAILGEIEADPSIRATDISLDIESGSWFKKRRLIHIRGTVRTRDQERRVSEIAQKCAGGFYEVVNHLVVKMVRTKP